MNFSPISLFVYNRLEHTKKTVEALKKNELAINSDLIIFSDAAKSESGVESIRVLRKYLKTISGFKSVKIIERLENLGLAKSIISGVTEVVSEYGKIIVLEDDLITSPYFLRYMNDALNMYENNDEVISIHGYIYPVKQDLPETFFLKGADCWGWATWKRGWDLFEQDGKKLLSEIKRRGLGREFDFNGRYPYVQMLKSQILGFNNSWAIRWYALAFLKNKLTLYPGHSLVFNSGFDNSGTHTGNTSAFYTTIHTEPIKINKIEIIEDKNSKNKIINYFEQPKLKIIISYIRLRFYLKLIKKYVKEKI